MSKTTKTTIYICHTCRPDGFKGEDTERPGNRFAKAVAQKAAETEHKEQLDILTVNCLSVCKRPCTVAVAAEGKFTYVIGDLELGRDEQAVIDFARSYAASEDGITPWRERPEVVRKGTVARIPAIGTNSALVTDINS